MKIKSIATICKKNKLVCIHNHKSRSGDTITQWIGDGLALYQIEGLPYMDGESLLTVFDVPEKQRDKWLVMSGPELGSINFADVDDTEEPVEQYDIMIAYGGETLIPIPNSDIPFEIADPVVTYEAVM